MIQPVLSALAGKRQAGERQAKLQQLVAFSSVRRPAMYRIMVAYHPLTVATNEILLELKVCSLARDIYGYSCT